jgi:hypothetical protein
MAEVYKVFFEGSSEAIFVANSSGPMSMISDVPDKRGLHHLTERFVGEVLEKNKDNIKIVLRDMKISNII